MVTSIIFSGYCAIWTQARETNTQGHVDRCARDLLYDARESSGKAWFTAENSMANYPSLRVRVILRPGTLLGPGKADLLDAIDATGSIAAAGRRLGMSYKRAWYLVDTMNAYFRAPVVVSTKGGKAGGGAQ